MIEKSPPSWSNFKHGIKHELKEVGLEDLIVRIRIEKDNRKQHKPRNSVMAKANLVGEKRTRPSQPDKGKGKVVT